MVKHERIIRNHSDLYDAYMAMRNAVAFSAHGTLEDLIQGGTRLLNSGHLKIDTSFIFPFYIRLPRSPPVLHTPSHPEPKLLLPDVTTHPPNEGPTESKSAEASVVTPNKQGRKRKMGDKGLVGMRKSTRNKKRRD
ncbi:hypothetical protein K439DRAFT_1641103 [Ramaria rubella]|nr:hypothetical protein K439DRAFT_1641103 [Ramaria rubella]